MCLDVYIVVICRLMLRAAPSKFRPKSLTTPPAQGTVGGTKWNRSFLVFSFAAECGTNEVAESGGRIMV